MFEDIEFWYIFSEMPVLHSLVFLIIGFLVSLLFYRKTGKVLKIKTIKKMLLDDKNDDLIANDVQSIISFHKKSIVKLDKALVENPDNTKLKKMRDYHGKILEILEEK